MRQLMSLRAAVAVLLVLLGTTATAQNLNAYIFPACPVTQPVKIGGGGDNVGFLAALVIQQLVSRGVDIAGTALAEAAKDKVSSISAESASTAYYTMDSMGSLKVSDKVGCVVLMSGGQGKAEIAQPAWLEIVKAKFAEQQIEVTGTPDFYLELQLERSEVNLGLRATPRLIQIGRPLADGGFFSRKSGKDYVVSLSFLDESTGSAFGALSFTFQGLEKSIAYVGRDSAVPGVQKLQNWPSASHTPKLPQLDAIKEAQSGQKSAIAPYLESNAIRKKDARKATAAPEKASIDKDTDYRKKVEALCVAISQGGKDTGREQTKATSKPAEGEEPKDGSKASDSRCPYGVWLAKQEADDVAKAVDAKLLLEWANAFYEKKCPLTTDRVKDPLKDRDGVVSVMVCQLPKPKPEEIGPFYVSATVVETAEASKFVKALAASFAEKKETLKTQLNDRINPARRDEIALIEEASERSARQKYQLALLKVAQLEASLSEASGSSGSARKAIEIQLVQARIDANTAARSAGDAIPYPEYD